MSSKTLCAWVRFAVIAAAICGGFLCLVFPSWMKNILSELYGTQGSYLWIGYVLLSAVPCFAVLCLIWRVAGAIRYEKVFTEETAKTIHTAAIWLFSDAIYVFLGNIVLFLMNINHPGIVLCIMAGVLLLIVFGVLAAVLSRYISKAADLQEISEGMI